MLEFIGITSFILLVAISPGADFAIIVRNSILYSRTTALFTALGIGGSLVAHTTYSLMGLALLISKSIFIFCILKYLGAMYLCYLGIKSIFSKESEDTISEIDHKKKLLKWQAFQQGFLCNLLNPKAPLFFISFYSVVIPTESDQLVKLLYGIESIVLITLWFVLLSVIISQKLVKEFFSKSKQFINKALGSAMLFFGVKLAFTSNE
ncbi:LysE family transporter [Desulfofustis glycolicus]|uniref:Resistance to homoserine/threonine (RhtB) family protein n=1 Tax=Desulfofustis glycolicus DSM 9705 TaxID=1121409 RepID=A0A1M5YR21_9BACT|nr:LysE family transporter [Desulfofustis glycolicus]MCB2218709.1 LysE family transporter [Desulfobulbaceae bacterium]SHI14557.1 resistance to homoserine/threonine (RhtB) family protein [Desulfofustis glycolicus DSM 9705]